MSKRTRASAATRSKRVRGEEEVVAIETVIEKEEVEEESSIEAVSNCSIKTSVRTTRTVTVKKGKEEAEETETIDEKDVIVVSSNINTVKNGISLSDYRLEWSDHGTLYILDSAKSSSHRVKGSNRIASFDLDSTLITTQTGKTFAKGRTDWKWLFPSIPDLLRAKHAEGWKLVIFTNQNGVSKGQTSKAVIGGKILDIIKEIGVPIQVFAACADDLFRKPSTQMWNHFIKHFNDGIEVDLTQSVYVGDAAGREHNWDGKGTKQDFSCADRKYAHNIGITFHTPEEYFLGHAKAKFKWPAAVDPMALLTAGTKGTTITNFFGVINDGRDSSASTTAAKPNSSSTSSSSSVTAAASSSSSSSASVHRRSHQELVVFVGYPSSGKSTFARTHFISAGYTHVNQDTFKTKEKCLRVAKEAISAGKSVVIDNTNPEVSTRKLYLDLAKSAKIPCRCYYFSTSWDLSRHLNMYREKLTEGKHKHVPTIAYHSYKKKFQMPTIKEGFTQVDEIPFVAAFAGEKELKLFQEMNEISKR